MKMTDGDLQKLNATIFGRFLEFVQTADVRPKLNSVEALQVMLFVLLSTCKPHTYGGAGAMEQMLENFDDIFPDEGEAVLQLLFQTRALDGALIKALPTTDGGKILFLPEQVVKIGLADGEEWLRRMLGGDADES
jgi:hypothetical protein